MCKIDVREPKPGYIEIRCLISGKPVTKTNDVGMCCEDMCELEEERKAKEAFKTILSTIMPDLDFSKF